MHVVRMLFVCAGLFMICAQSNAAAQTSDQAVDAYRSEDYDTAAALWIEQLENSDAVDAAGQPSVSARERARWMANVGNCAARQNDWANAAGWFEASMRLRPRDAETRKKLDFARSEAGWTALDRGDLASTADRFLSAFTEDEARWLALIGLLPLLIALAGEALRGGRAWRQAAIASAVVWLACCVPCVHAAWVHAEDPMLVTAPNGAAARPEPRESAERLERLPSGSHFERLDELPGWTKLRGTEGQSVWVPSRDVFALNR